MNPLWRSFRALARRGPGRRLVRGGPAARWRTARALRREAGRIAARLRRAGVRRADVVLVVASNRPAFVAAALGVWAADAVLLAVEEGIAASERARIEAAFRPAASITTAGGRPRVAGRAPSGAAAGPLRCPGAAMIRLTSGTTGAPRGVLVTARQLEADARAIIARTGLRPGDVNLGVVPLSHTYGFDQIVVPMILQGTPALLLRQPLPSLILRALRARGPLVLAAVPYILDLLARRAEGAAARRSGLRICLSAGAPLPRRTAAAFRERFGVPVRTLYGTSETGAVSSDDTADGSAPEGCVGRPLPGVRVGIARRGPGRLPGSEGRVVVRGPAVASRYVPDASPELGAGRFLTSDLGRLDAEGRLHLTGRVSHLVNVSGRKVNPAEVERALLSIPGVADAAALGVRDPLRGERLEAWVVAEDGRAPASIRGALAGRLAAHKLPRAIHVVTALPRTARGKLDRARLLPRP